MINVTKTFLPPQAEYNAILKRAWDKNWLTNRGVLVQELEDKLKNYLGVEHIIATTNGTLPLQIAIKALKLTGEIITTPFSYVASTSSIVWEGCTPVFVDIHPEYLTIDETKIEAAITTKTSAILATHVFGNPCNVEAIEIIAKKHHLKVIYDAAHCFGVTYKGQSIFNYGDISTCSFHATKVFHTGEGGALFSSSAILNDTLFYHHNFGHKGALEFQGLGINAKMSELQGAMGLAVLPYMKTIFTERKKVVDFYDKNIDFTKVRKIQLREGTIWNNSYYPVIFESENQLLIVEKELNKHQIIPRRYFYPSLNQLPYLKGRSMPISEHISSCILCLPLYFGLKLKELEFICSLI
ncbi:DegT/DnrJ/EryC1/StrS aminotransferase family protein [Lutibacter sp.]|uniref:DegT/DnrJ/EryC1/StrS family aminotransferase n=1 Tax=Lutibacter sp. TaxID=1925666 RepID=UPI0027330393|nr:DegT/DnrJ/EryC1/StrS family aminotransferase [Lutibacter sp.]MDP3312571.1 DegT/DnrJ/EryC1/StrS family aminotransferase [Lutibacter sp.]